MVGYITMVNVFRDSDHDGASHVGDDRAGAWHDIVAKTIYRIHCKQLGPKRFSLACCPMLAAITNLRRARNVMCTMLNL